VGGRGRPGAAGNHLDDAALYPELRSAASPD
jgi:hypothetical protein